MNDAVGISPRSDAPAEIVIDEQDHAQRRCPLSLDNITLIRPALCTGKIADLSAEVLHAVCESLGLATACGRW